MPLDLLDRRDLDQQTLTPRRVELNLGDALGADAGDVGDLPVAEIGVPPSVIAPDAILVRLPASILAWVTV